MILLVEDEKAIAIPLSQYLGGEGFATRVAGTAALAEQEVKRAAPQLVILDWALPDRPGVDLLRDWRRDRQHFPVILLTARHELIDKVLGLELGADDFMTKPFEPRELLARIRARLRGAEVQAGISQPPMSPGILTSSGLMLNLSTREVHYLGRLVDLTKLEFDLLKFLLEHKNQVFSRDELLNRVWGYDAYPTTRTIDTHVLQLRQKFAATLFEAVRGIGYRFREAKT